MNQLIYFNRYRAVFDSIGIAVLVALVARLASFWIVSEFEIYTEHHSRVSPFFEPTSGDYLFYKQFASDAVPKFLSNIKELFSYFIGQSDSYVLSQRPGPVLPALIAFFDYKQGNTIPFALVFALTDYLLCCGWIIWLNNKGISKGWLVIFATLPTPIYYSLIVQSDLIYASLIFFFYHFYNQQNQRHNMRLFLNFWTMTVCLLTRPNALSLYPVFLTDLFRNKNKINKIIKGILVILSSVGLVFFLAYYAPYFLKHVSASIGFTYFGVNEKSYIQGLFPLIANPFNWLMSWSCLFVAKLLYLCGLRPSYSGVDWHFVLLRSLPGLITFPGLIYLFLRGAKHDKIFCFFFLAPFIIGVAQERYLLPIQPLLFYYGILGFKALKLSIGDKIKPTK